MTIDETKYNDLFIKKFKVQSNELYNELKWVIDKFGNTEEVKLAFYSKTFETVVSQFKKDLPKDENYAYIITTLYKYFIDVLEVDKIENSRYKKDLEDFKNIELAMFQAKKATSTEFKPVYKTYNPNTKYGRRKAREQASLNYQNGSPEYKKEIDNIATVVWIIIIFIVIVVFLVKIALNT